MPALRLFFGVCAVLLASCAGAGSWIPLPPLFPSPETYAWPEVLEKDPSPISADAASPEEKAQAVAFLDYARGKDLARAEPFLDRVAALGPKALPALQRAAADRDADLRFKATILLGEIDDPRAVETLARRLGDSDEDVAILAARSLAKRNEPWVAPRLFDCFLGKNRHPSTRVRAEAARAATELGFPQAIPFLLTVLRENTRLAEPQGGWKDWPWDGRWAWQKWVAGETLESASGIATGFDANQGVPQMEESIRPWIDWWEEKGRKLEISPAARNDPRFQKMLGTLRDAARSGDPESAPYAQAILQALDL